MFKVGIVDDEALFREYLRTIISWEDYGFTVCMEASDGKEALQLAEETPPDILFADINMPLMDGLAMSKEIKQSHPDMVIVIITGYSEFEYARDALRIGIDDFIVKPFDKEELLALLLRLKSNPRMAKNRKAFVESFLSAPESANQKRAEVALGIKEYIEKHYMDSGLRTEKIATAMYMDASYLRRIFKEGYGMRITEYITKVRMEEAYRLLSKEMYSSHEICEAIGFNDIHYFYKVFRKYFGISPGSSRRETD